MDEAKGGIFQALLMSLVERMAAASGSDRLAAQSMMNKRPLVCGPAEAAPRWYTYGS